jgi:hypothetical protein
MKASWQEDYFKALIRLRLLLPVNPKTGTQKCDRCRIVARPEPRGLLLIEPRCLGKEEGTDGKQRGIGPFDRRDTRAVVRFLSWLASRPSAV